MSLPEKHWWSVRAGEYALGTLRGEDLRLFEEILASDTDMQTAVADWERRLYGLNETIQERTPGEHVLPEILGRIRLLDNQDTVDGEDSTAPASLSLHPTDTVHSQSGRASSATASDSSSLWRSWAGLATAASLILGVLLMQQKIAPTSLPLNVDGVAVVLSDDSGTPYFLVETDYGNLNVRVTALSPPSLDETQDFQLWQALPDRSSVRPVTLLPEEAGTARIVKVNSLVEGSDLFGVSIEPVGAVTDNGPTGPVVAHGDFQLLE